MAKSTDVPILTYTVSGTTTNDVTFSNLPQEYSTLKIVTNLRNIGNVAVLRGQFNGDSGNTYSSTALNGDGSSGSSGRQTNVNAFYMTYQGHINSTPATGIYYIPNYSSNNSYKTVLSRSSNPSFGVDVITSLWRGSTGGSTEPITSIRIVNDRAEYWAAGSTISIYGIGTASPAKATGGAIYSDDQYWYHVFTNTSAFIPTQSLTADVLVIAGGGGGGNFGGGGGGAGGIQGFTSQSLTATAYTVTVGSGGAGGAANSALYGTAGGNSQFGALTASVGGGRGGGRATSSPGTTGGSGGGNAYSLGSLAGTSGQGYAGGAGTANGGGGGGGAGEAGNTDAGQGTGGDGTSAYTSWYPVTLFGENISGTYYLAGGGGGWGDNGVGGTGGDGGGGTGAGVTTVRCNALAYTGSGGGATAQTIAGGNGGSGLVIVRYAK